MNIKTLEKLEYNKLKEKVKAYCVSQLGRDKLDSLEISSNPIIVKKLLQETSQARAILDGGNQPPLSGIGNISQVIENLDLGVILNPREVQNIGEFLRGSRRIRAYMEERENLAPLLASYGKNLVDLGDLEDEIARTIRAGQIDTNASSHLSRIRRKIEDTEDKIREKLDNFLRKESNQKYIQEFFISKKSDKYTIPIKAAYKNKVAGSIVETSSKGATVFIEPSGVAKLSTELSSLLADQAMEEYQILASLTGFALENLDYLKASLDTIGTYDMIFAKGKHSRQIDGIQPRINRHGYIKLVGASHPLLEGRVIPLDFEIGQDYRGLVITGPNAGGKTLVLKTIGLLSLALMSGFHIQAQEGTELAIFDSIFVDIGDDQSMENSLSTFSSHMKNISEIMDQAGNNSLVLFDEIGSGTEPNEGAALAIAILEEFYHQGCIIVATTHYGEIKNFSAGHPDFINAAMQFDNNTMEPMYKLLMGQSGESNALWISRKMKIKDQVLDRAKTYMETGDYSYEKLDASKLRVRKDLNLEGPRGFEIGDKVILKDYKDFGVIYGPIDEFNKQLVAYQGQLIELNIRRMELELAREDLYPADYDFDEFFARILD